jgi:hypothetical protein
MPVRGRSSCRWRSMDDRHRAGGSPRSSAPLVVGPVRTRPCGGTSRNVPRAADPLADWSGCHLARAERPACRRVRPETVPSADRDSTSSTDLTAAPRARRRAAGGVLGAPAPDLDPVETRGGAGRRVGAAAPWRRRPCASAISTEPDRFRVLAARGHSSRRPPSAASRSPALRQEPQWRAARPSATACSCAMAPAPSRPRIMRKRERWRARCP